MNKDENEIAHKDANKNDKDNIPYYLKRLEDPFFLKVQALKNLDPLQKKAAKKVKKENSKLKFKEFLKIEELKLESEKRNESEKEDLQSQKIHKQKIEELQKYMRDGNISRLNSDLCWDMMFDIIWSRIKT